MYMYVYPGVKESQGGGDFDHWWALSVEGVHWKTGCVGYVYLHVQEHMLHVILLSIN